MVETLYKLESEDTVQYCFVVGAFSLQCSSSLRFPNALVGVGRAWSVAESRSFDTVCAIVPRLAEVRPIACSVLLTSFSEITGRLANLPSEAVSEEERQ
jgi:hypothetical protein